MPEQTRVAYFSMEIALNGAFFSTQRVVRPNVRTAYFEGTNDEMVLAHRPRRRH